MCWATLGYLCAEVGILMRGSYGCLHEGHTLTPAVGTGFSPFLLFLNFLKVGGLLRVPSAKIGYDRSLKFCFFFFINCFIGIQSPYQGFPGDSDSKESASNARDPGSFPRSGRFPGEENGYPFQYSCLKNPHGQRSLVGYSP